MSSGTYVETAPSPLTEDQASFARTVGLTGLMATVLGTLILILNAAKARIGIEIGNNVAFAAIVVGLAMMFFHAARDTDPFVRRMYGYIGGIGLPLAGAILSLLPVAISWARSQPVISLFFPFGWACFLVGLFYLMSYCRNETEEKNRWHGLLALVVIGGFLAAFAFIGGLIVASYALTYGSVMALLALGYLVAFVSQLGGADLGGYWPALAIGALGVLVFLVALGRSLFPGNVPFFVPAGLVLMAFGLAYALTAVFLVSDWTIVVLTRRELMAYFASPIAYILLFISALVAWINYNQFVYILSASRVPVQEPIVLIFYLGNLFGVFMLVFQVPALTMRLISEEKRTGTYEVLMCAPVSEIPVVLSKLLAALAFYLLIWAVWLVFLLDVRVEAGKPFEYRPLISFYLALAASGASFLAMGLFFSSLTRNQIVAAAMTFVGMVAWIVLFLIARDLPEESTRFVVLNHLSFVTLWADSLRGRLHLPDLVIQVSIAVFFTFLTVKVLEARRWS
jgi:gliding motility-associated transport system permease protein